MSREIKHNKLNVFKDQKRLNLTKLTWSDQIHKNLTNISNLNNHKIMEKKKLKNNQSDPTGLKLEMVEEDQTWP